MISNGLPVLVEAEKRRVEATTWDEDREVDNHIIWDLQERLDSGMTTRFVGASVVIAAWALYESGVRSVADYIRREKSVKCSLDKVKGLKGHPSFLEKARLYFSDHLKFELHGDAEWTGLKQLADIRNALAHNSCVSDIPEKKRDKIFEYCEADPDLKVEGDFLVVLLPFAERALTLVERLRNDLIDRTMSAFK